MARCQRCNKFLLLKPSSGYCKDCDILIAEEERKKRAEQEKRHKEEADRKHKAEEERKRKAEEERKRKAEEERKRMEEAQRRMAEEAHRRIEERKRRAEEERKRMEEESRRKSKEKLERIEEENKLAAEEKRQRIEEDRKRKEEEEQKQRAQAVSEKTVAKIRSEEEIEKAQKLLDAALDYYNRGEYDIARIRFEGITELYPDIFPESVIKQIIAAQANKRIPKKTEQEKEKVSEKIEPQRKEAGKPVPSKKAKEAFDAAMDYYNKGEYEIARTRFEGISTLYSGDFLISDLENMIGKCTNAINQKMESSRIIKNREDAKELYDIAKKLQKEEKYSDAFPLFIQAKELGAIEACNEVGESYFYGNGVEKNVDKAFEWYMKGAVAGDAAAQGNVGYCFAAGIGTQQDFVKSCEWLQKAADQGNADAIFNLANRYREGQGVSKDPSEAFKFYLEAADKGNPMGYLAGGIMLYDGGDLEQDYVKAYQLFTKCANEINHRQARYYMGEMCLWGKGVTKDLATAGMNLSLSALQGYPDAIDLIDQYGSTLFSDEVTTDFYYWIMAQTVRYRDISQSPDMKLFKLAFNCRSKGMDEYTMIGIIASQLLKLAYENVKSDQRVKIDFVKLARKWSSKV